jgi:hypothetical protein
MDEFKKLNVVFAVGLVGIVIALAGSIYDWSQKKEQAAVEAQQIQAVPADTAQGVPASLPAPSVATPGVPADSQ